jgi:glycosyltransferase involved in cell wall biosynthesis
MVQKKIIFVITKGNWGGAQRYVYDLATQLPREQFTAKVIVGRGRELPEKLALAGIETITLPHLKRDLDLFSDLKIFFALVRIFRREQPDIVHLNSPKAGGLGALAARIVGVKKIIYTAHGWTFNEPRSWLVKKIIWLGSWITVLLSNVTITITGSEQAQGLRMPWSAKKIKLIRNGLATPNFLSREIARTKLFSHLESSVISHQPSVVLIGTIAELHRNKGLKYLIEALAGLPRDRESDFTWQAVIIGAGEEKTVLEKLIVNRQLENQVKLIGFIPNAAELLPAFDIFILPSLKEGLPYVILEAGLAKLPVIATNVGGVPEIITRDYSGLLVSPKNPAALVAAIQSLIDSPVLRQKLGQQLEQQVMAEYSLTKMVEQFAKLYS